MIWSWLHRYPVAVDVALVALLLFLGVGNAAHRHGGAAAVVLAVCETLPLLVRRRRPVQVTAAIAGIDVLMIALGVWLLPLQLGVALYTLTALRRRRSERAVGVLAIVALAAAEIAEGGLELGPAATRIVFLVAAALLGDSIGSRRAYIREIEEKAARLEREQEIETRRATAEEQARIARELHDVIAHALSVIVVQAGAAEDAFARDPESARAPLHAIDAAARTALADLRRVLGVLHSSPDYRPQPGLDGLDELLETVRATGLKVSLEVAGDPRPLPGSVELSAYRIVQEALTNTLKHADAERVRVSVRYGDTLRLDVRDDGRGGANGHGHGSGLIGMRERVAMLGGTLVAERLPAGGFHVAAELPLERTS